MTEFDLIKNYFATQLEHRADVILGIGDDAALVKPAPDQALAITTDTLVAGVHFLETDLPYDIGYKSLAVNLSDLAAMGAEVAWITLALTLPNDNEIWIQNFCDGFFTLANRYQVQLIGGDLTQGPLTITVQAIGLVPAQSALRRCHAQPSDLIYVTGTLGDAGLALAFLQNKIQLDSTSAHEVLAKLHRPEPRLATGICLRDFAHAAIDVSDGLAADLGHILEQSKVGATLYVDKLPLSNTLTQSVSHEEAIALALTSGDDYELCFTVPADKRIELEKKLSTLACRFTCIGEITVHTGMDLRYEDGKKYHGSLFGYQHF